MRLPSWVTPLVRIVLAVLIIAIGGSRWADGYGMALIGIGTAAIVAELVGAGFSQSQSEELASWIALVIKQEVGKVTGTAPGSPAPPSTPPTQPIRPPPPGGPA